MNLIERLHIENKARALTDEESAELARAVKREKWNAYKRHRYANDPEHRLRTLENKRANYARRKAAISSVGLSRQTAKYVYNEQSV